MNMDTCFYNGPLSSKDDFLSSFINTKILFFQEIIKNTFISLQNYMRLEIIDRTQLIFCYESLEKIMGKLAKTQELQDPLESIVLQLQEINNDLSSLIKIYGTLHIEDLLIICLGTDFHQTLLTSENSSKYEFISKYLHPIEYKIDDVKKKTKERKKKDLSSSKNKKGVDEGTTSAIAAASAALAAADSLQLESAESFDCFDVCKTNKQFFLKVHGIKIVVHHLQLQKSLTITCVVDDYIPVEYFSSNKESNSFIKAKLECIHQMKTNPNDMIFNQFISALTCKDLLIYSNDDIWNLYKNMLKNTEKIRQKQLQVIIYDFVKDKVNQRQTIIHFLLHNDMELNYMAFLMFNLLSNEKSSHGGSSSSDSSAAGGTTQSNMFDSFPLVIKKKFKYAHITENHEEDSESNILNKIPYEKQIYLMKATESVKEKAYAKLKEVNNKSDDSGNKPRQYLDGLLKIPFNIFRKEPILSIISKAKTDFQLLAKSLTAIDPMFSIDKYSIYTSPDIFKMNSEIKLKMEAYEYSIRQEFLSKINSWKKKDVEHFTSICFPSLHTSKKNIVSKKKELHDIISNSNDLFTIISESLQCPDFEIHYDVSLIKKINTLIDNIDHIQPFVIEKMNKTKHILNQAVHGHDLAKRHIERIIGQWINGKDSGYNLGFEGPPGVGKTSLAKYGISQCLEDENGVKRPFSFIAVGGSSNGSTFDGHNYTYVGSQWGKIVDVLMEQKCMNPIIFIDELDKISMTEQGKEIIGILTHMTDPTQNSSFQDKYFNGIDIDLSKVLFIFSYNDASKVDRILLDRIHRIKFDHLALCEKLVIVKKHILPEIMENMGLQNNISMDDDVIQYIIENYTSEPGVRKLKELINEIIGEINLDYLYQKDLESPFIITKKLVKERFMKERRSSIATRIHSSPEIGVINGLWANVMGEGGIITIESSFFPSEVFMELKLTGLQGDVMKESMNVAKTLAWNMTSTENQKSLKTAFSSPKGHGIHIHCPEGSTPKDGPSAGTAITTVIYSLLSNTPIKNTIAITGEIDLKGNITAIGGLDLKILGGIRAGVITFLFPKENEQDYDLFLGKYSAQMDLKPITFHMVSHIREVLEIVFD